MNILKQLIEKSINDYKKIKKKQKEKELKEKALKLKKEHDIKKLVRKELQFLYADLENKEEEIYKKVRKRKIKKGELDTINKIELQPVEKKGINIPFISKNKDDYDYVIEYYSKFNTKKYIGLSAKEWDKLLSFENGLYVNNNREDELREQNKHDTYFYKGKKIISIHEDSPITLSLNINNKELFADSKTFNWIVNDVFDYQITIPKKTTGQLSDIFEMIKKNWLIIVMVIVFLVLEQNGVLSSFFGG